MLYIHERYNTIRYFTEEPPDWEEYTLCNAYDAEKRILKVIEQIKQRMLKDGSSSISDLYWIDQANEVLDLLRFEPLIFYRKDRY